MKKRLYIGFKTDSCDARDGGVGTEKGKMKLRTVILRQKAACRDAYDDLALTRRGLQELTMRRERGYRDGEGY